MFLRNPLAFGQKTAQLLRAGEIAFAMGRGASHLRFKACLSLLRVPHIPCDPSPDFAPGLVLTGRLFAGSPQRDRQEVACGGQFPGCTFRLPGDALKWAHKTSPNGGRACVFPPSPFLQPSRLRPPVACNRSPMSQMRMRIMVANRPPACCKRRAAVRSSARLSARPRLMPLTKTWSPAQPLARLPVVRPAMFRGLTTANNGIVAADLTAATAARYIVIKASRGDTPAGLLCCSARRPACR